MTQVTPPPGLVGAIAKSIYAMSPRPVAEISLGAAIGLMSGVCGRSHNVSGMGLNHLVLVLARTGRGKEAANSGISKIVTALCTPKEGSPLVREAWTFLGPSDAASGQGLARALAERAFPCFVSIVGEFGHRYGQMADDRATDANKALRRFMLDSYQKSGKGNRLGSTVYSDKAKNIPAMLSPALSMVAEATPSSFYPNVDERTVADGTLSRFNIMEYDGPRSPLNEAAFQTEPDPQMLDYLSSLMTKSIALNEANDVIEVTFDREAKAFCDEFNLYADARINESSGDVLEELWNRAHIKLLKLAALVAVGIDYNAPVITLPVAKWAHAQIDRDIRRIISRFESGDVGAIAGNELKQQDEVRRVIREYLEAPYEKYERMGGTREMHRNGIFTESYIQRRLISLPLFRLDPAKGTPSIKRALQNLTNAAEIEEFPMLFIYEKFGRKFKSYRLAISNANSHEAIMERVRQANGKLPSFSGGDDLGEQARAPMHQI